MAPIRSRGAKRTDWPSYRTPSSSTNPRYRYVFLSTETTWPKTKRRTRAHWTRFALSTSQVTT